MSTSIKPVALLTEREREVLALICEGAPNQVIAERLHLSIHTVKHHQTNIKLKLSIRDRLKLVLFAWENQLCPLPSTLLAVAQAQTVTALKSA